MSKILSSLGWIAILAGTLVAQNASMEVLESLLHSSKCSERLEAVKQISIDCPGQSLVFLKQVSSDPDKYVRERAVQALGTCGDRNAISTVVCSLQDRDEFVRWRAVQALGSLRASDVITDLAPLVNDHFWRVRASTCDLLGAIALEQIQPEKPETGSRVIDAHIKKLLLRGLEDPDERVKLAAAVSLARNLDKAAFIPLTELLKEGSLFTRDAAAQGLGELGDHKAVGILIEGLEDPRNSVSCEGANWANWGIVKALRKLTGQAYGSSAPLWRHWYERSLRN